MAGNLFQQLYNTVDSIVVGNFVGKEALAAVGSTDSVINTFIGFFPACPPVQASSFPNIMAAKRRKGFCRRPDDHRADTLHEHSLHGARPFACSIPAAPHGHSG